MMMLRVPLTTGSHYTQHQPHNGPPCRDVVKHVVEYRKRNGNQVPRQNACQMTHKGRLGDEEGGEEEGGKWGGPHGDVGGPKQGQHGDAPWATHRHDGHPSKQDAGVADGGDGAVVISMTVLYG